MKLELKEPNTLTTEELDSIYEIEISCIDDPTPYFEDKTDLLDFTFPRYNIIAWSHENNLIGYLTLETDKLGIWTISNLAVRKNYRRLGVATRMVKEALAFVEAQWDGMVLELQCPTKNLPAISVYLKTGFVITNTIKNFYHFKEDAHQMQKSVRFNRRDTGFLHGLC